MIKIEGPPTDADKAHEILESQAKDLMSTMNFVEINVDAKYHKHIIGKGGSTGKYLSSSTKSHWCKILNLFRNLNLELKI